MDIRIATTLQELARSEAIPLRTRGTCMEPLLRDGAVTSVTARRFYLPGDVVVFRTPAGDLAAHRVLGFRTAGLVTKGDGCVIHDAPVPRRDVIGAVALDVPIRDRIRAIAHLATIALRVRRR